METYKTHLFHWAIGGAFFIICFGGLLHFLFAWTGGWTPVALIAAVNESVWEHLKMVFWPGLIFIFVSFPFLRNKTQNFWTAQISGLLAMPIFILALFYAHKVIFNTHNLAYDIAIFVFAVIFGQWTSYRLMFKPQSSLKFRFILVVLLLSAIAVFSLFSYFPPKYPLFQDSRSGEYGIHQNVIKR